MKPRNQTRRFFAPDLSSDRIRPSAGELHHAIHVLRLKNEDRVELFDGMGCVAIGAVEYVDRKNILINIIERQILSRPSGPLIHLALAEPKGKRLDWLVEKASELGAASLQRVVFERSGPGARSESKTKHEKLHAHCISAAKQCGLNFLPELPAPVMLGDLLSSDSRRLGILGDTEPDAIGLHEAIGRKSMYDNIMLLIGPEGGLTEDERRNSIASGFAPVRIAATTLRIETAAIAMLGAVSASLPITPTGSLKQ